jgi:hypothetical protein
MAQGSGKPNLAPDLDARLAAMTGSLDHIGIVAESRAFRGEGDCAVERLMVELEQAGLARTTFLKGRGISAPCDFAVDPSQLRLSETDGRSASARSLARMIST